MTSAQTELVTRSPQRLAANPSRVITRLFVPGQEGFELQESRAGGVLARILALATGDARFQRRSEERIRELREEAGTVFLVSHNNTAIRDTCERTIWLENGIIRMDGSTEEVVGAYEEYMGKKK